MEIKQTATHITFEVTKNDKGYSFIIPVESPFNDVFNVLFECVNKVNDLVVNARVDDAIKKASEKPQEEVTVEVMDATVTSTSDQS